MPAWTLYSLFVGTALKGTAVLGAAWIAALLLRRKSAAVRHLVWSAAFAALLALPFLSLALPALRMPAATSLLAPGLIFRANSSAVAQQPASHAERQPEAEPLRAANSWLPDWRIFFALVWSAGATVSFAQMFIGWLALQRFKRSAHPFRASELAPLIRLLEMEDRVDLLEAPRGSMPMTCGLFHAVVFVPIEIAEWSAERRRVVLLHELAHVRRGDGATHLLARTALSLYWWNPLAWIAWREFLKERERAADDLVLRAGAGASEYATHLLEIARSMQSPASLGWAAVAMARRSQLEGRLLAILDSGRDRSAPRRASAMAAALSAIGIIAPFAALQAQSDTEQLHIANQTSVSSAAALVAKGDLEREQGKFDQARTIYKQALATLGSGPEAATALIHLGTVELATKDFDQAISDFTRAQTVDSGKTAEARMWMAIAQQHQNNLEAADALYQSALAAEDPNSAAAATIMELYARVLQQQDRQGEADTMQKQATDIRKTHAAEIRSAHLPASDVYRVGGDVTAPVLIFKTESKYTAEARIAKYQGAALLSVEIGSDGLPRDIRAVRALGFGLTEKAVEAVSQWKFKPGTKDGQPVTVAATIEVNFKLL